MRVLVTGHRGYIGSVLTCMLRNARCDVVGLDCDHYRQCDFGRIAEDVPSYDTDVRNVELGDLLSFDAVIHLAGLPDGLSSQFDRSTLEETNLHATARLASLAKQAEVLRFIFASTCDVYGKTGATIATESCETRPTTQTAELKLLAEREILSLADFDFSPVVLRQGDVYGVSPRLRLDLVVNDLVASAITHGRVVGRVSPFQGCLGVPGSDS